MKRDVSYMKPKKFRDHLTIAELSERINLDRRWIERLEKDGRIPRAARVTIGKIKDVRLWSPAQADEIEEIISTHQPGRPANE